MPALPMWLNAMETIAWIVTRDPDVVALAADTPRVLSEREADDWDLPSNGRTSLAWLDAHVCGKRWEDAIASLAAAESREPIEHIRAYLMGNMEVQPTASAVHKLVEAARMGKVQTKARRIADGPDGDHQPFDWAGHTLAKVDGDVALCRTRRSHPPPSTAWTAPLFSRDDVLRLWPGADAAEALATRPPREALRTASKDEIHKAIGQSTTTPCATG